MRRTWPEPSPLASDGAVPGDWRGPTGSLPLGMPPDPLVLSTATRADLADLLSLEEAAFPVDRISHRAWRHLVEHAHGRVVVARDARGELLGAAVVLFRRGSQVARLYSLATAPAARGRGVGRTLLAEVVAEARRRGRERLRLEVRTDNETALQLYRSAGFTAVGELPDYYVDGSPALRMEAALRPQGA